MVYKNKKGRRSVLISVLDLFIRPGVIHFVWQGL